MHATTKQKSQEMIPRDQGSGHFYYCSVDSEMESQDNNNHVRNQEAQNTTFSNKRVLKNDCY